MCLASCGGARWQRCAESGIGSDSRAPVPAGSPAAARRRAPASPPRQAQLATGCGALPELGNAPLCRAPRMHGSCRYDLADRSLGAAGLQVWWAVPREAEFAKQGQGESGISKEQRYVWNREKFDLVGKSKLLKAAGLISSNRLKYLRGCAYHMFPV